MVGKGLIRDLQEIYGISGIHWTNPRVSKEARVDFVIRRYSRGEIALPLAAPFLATLEDKNPLFSRIL